MEKSKSDDVFNYPFVAITSSILGFLFLICVIFFPPLGKAIGYAGLSMIVIGAIAGIIGYFKIPDRKAKRLCFLAVFFSALPFMLYFLIIHVVLPFVLSGITF